ncbi:FFLEELY motif protein [Caldimonas sp. KR1-144]|uniref:FFLEELY motif protein n=1 Tax=Caldimonas sp. KR1-144 TaxID=3400911 RepID=UPI003C0A9256
MNEILDELARVAQERDARASDARLASRVLEIKHFQQARFRHTYADLLASTRFGPATHFFLDQLYGPQDFTERDHQFERVVPALVRLFPGEIVATVKALTRLHALSEELDGAMALALPRSTEAGALDAIDYVRAWQAVGRRTDREAQISLVREIGFALDRYTRMPMLFASLRMMRGPARVAGLSSLQHFLESGFDTFKSMHGAQVFLDLIGERESAMVAALFDPAPLAPGRHPALVQLP